jgi:imidazole glycerol phosphate synthase glutamine amidotransferase subunit
VTTGDANVTEGDRGLATGDSAPTVAVVDYGAGNLVSIEQALTAAGARVHRAVTAEDIGDPDLLVVPGVGAAAPAMERLRDGGFVDPIRDWIAADRPFLGICLGLQLLFDGSDEDGAETLGILAGRTVRLQGAPTLPHIGWNQVVRRREHPAFAGIADGADFYFVHSFVGAPTGPAAGAITLAETEHGSRFVSAVARGRLLGVQFHPERSGANGLRFVANVVAAAAGSATTGAPMPLNGGDAA